MRVMIRMLTTTYGESVSCTPMCAIGEPIGPIENGITYIVRPRMQPRKSGSRRSFISRGATQLLVGPASPGETEQMNVRSSTRATSLGSERHRNEFGRFSSFRRRNVPLSTISSHSRAYSASLPSHQWMRSGCVSAATSSTQESRDLLATPCVMSIISRLPSVRAACPAPRTPRSAPGG